MTSEACKVRTGHEFKKLSSARLLPKGRKNLETSSPAALKLETNSKAVLNLETGIIAVLNPETSSLAALKLESKI